MRCVIQNVAFVDKWMQFWFSNSPPYNSAHRVCKSYMFRELLEKDPKLEREAYLDGVRGMVLIWPEGSDRPTGIESKFGKSIGGQT